MKKHETHQCRDCWYWHENYAILPNGKLELNGGYCEVNGLFVSLEDKMCREARQSKWYEEDDDER